MQPYSVEDYAETVTSSLITWVDQKVPCSQRASPEMSEQSDQCHSSIIQLSSTGGLNEPCCETELLPFKRSGCLELFRYSPKCNPHAKTTAPVALDDWFCKPLAKCLLDIVWKVNKTAGSLCQAQAQSQHLHSTIANSYGKISSSLDSKAAMMFVEKLAQRHLLWDRIIVSCD